jgi:hypothetical protein
MQNRTLQLAVVRTRRPGREGPPGTATARWPAVMLAILATLGALALMLASPAAAQQWVVDDAEIVDRGACQIEAWHGEVASWILPACQPFWNLEIAVGVGFVDEGDGHRETEYAVEAKTLFRPLATNDWGIGLVVGVGPNPSAAAGERRFGDVYAFVPASLSLMDDRLILHGNVGWEWERDGHEHDGHVHDEDHHHLTWGLRSDVGLTDRFTLIGEVFGEDRLLPEFQIGLRTHFEEAGVEVDLSWGGHTQDDLRGAGFTVGVALVSGRIF